MYRVIDSLPGDALLSRELGRQIHAIRTARGLTMKQITDLSGVSWPTLSRLERGQRAVNIDCLGEILRALNCTLQIVEDGE